MSKLTTVTFTGLDERVDLSAVVALSEEFPFVEWGTLLSATRTGTEPRYPETGRMAEIGRLPIRKSIHVCGTIARDAAAGTGYQLQDVLPLIPGSGRVQVNLGRGIDRFPGWPARAQQFGETFGVQVIMQTYGFKSPVVRETIGQTGNGYAVFLHDASGGRGVTGTFEQPVNSNYVGFAGGIRPENIIAKLEEIACLNIPNDFWIDMESGVRTDDWLDLAKCRAVLESVRPFIGTSTP